VTCWVDLLNANGGSSVTVPQQQFTRAVENDEVIWVGDRLGNRCPARVMGQADERVILHVALTQFRPATLTTLAASAPLSLGERVRGGVQYSSLSEIPVGADGREKREPITIQVTSDDRMTMADRALGAIQNAYTLAAQHLNAELGAHREPVLGCPWCIDNERARRLYTRLTERWPADEWPTLTVFQARVLCARGDVARAFKESQ
jgi:hypothetical protein